MLVASNYKFPIVMVIPAVIFNIHQLKLLHKLQRSMKFPTNILLQHHHICME